jgi:hypothetical protein
MLTACEQGFGADEKFFGFVMVRVDLEGAAIRRGGLIQPAHCPDCAAEQVVSVSVVRVGGYGPIQRFDGQVRLSRFEIAEPEIKPCVRVLRRFDGRGAESFNGIVKLGDSKRCQALLYQLLGRSFARH